MIKPIVLDPKLVGYWPLDEASGATAFDLGRGGNNGTINGTTRVKQTNGQRALLLGGAASNDYIAFGNVFNEYIAGPDKKFSIGGWVTVEQLPANQMAFFVKAALRKSLPILPKPLIPTFTAIFHFLLFYIFVSSII